MALARITAIENRPDAGEFVRTLRPFAALPLLTAACCAPVPEPEPVPTPEPIVTQTAPPAPAPPPPPPPPIVERPVYENWLDAPQTSGDWSYGSEQAETFATFGRNSERWHFMVRCDLRSKKIGFARQADEPAEAPMRIRTETAERLLMLTPLGNSRPLLVVELPANDRLLDAIALSRGRFAVETGGMETLYLPAWTEVSRVIEDCR